MIMEPMTESDAEILWRDVCDAMRRRSTPPNIMAMLDGCEPLNLTEDTLTVSTSRFARRHIQNNLEAIETCIEESAFMPIHLNIENRSVQQPARSDARSQNAAEQPGQTTDASEYQRAEFSGAQQTQRGFQQPASSSAGQPENPSQAVSAVPKPKRLSHWERRKRNSLMDDIPRSDSKLTFDRFIEADENHYALDYAKQVANGEPMAPNPLFIYGKSGLGKTHLLKAIQNYIMENDPERLCLYRTAKEFQNDYVSALNSQEFETREALRRDYCDIDVLIIDDIQNLTGQATIQFFFDTFNYLAQNGKQVILAADRTPRELNLDERVVSRIAGNIAVAMQVPSEEFKLILIKNFYERLKKDAQAEHINGYSGTISQENLELMAEKSGNNIRTIQGFCSECLMVSTTKEAKGGQLEKDDIIRLARARWSPTQAIITVKGIQQTVEEEYQIDHETLVGTKRKKEIKEARHVGIWLARELTDETLADIGKKFGGRTHATVVHSIQWVDIQAKESQMFYDKVNRLKESIVEDSLS